MGFIEMLETAQGPVVACGRELCLVRGHEAIRLAAVCAAGASTVEQEEVAELLAAAIAAGRAADA